MTGRINAVVARKLGHVSRQAAGLIPPVSISTNIDPADGGTVLHHGGTDVPIGSHLECLSTWRGWQAFHMGANYSPPRSGHGWADLAYTVGACQHGYTLGGRGLGIRTAANGTTAGNLRYYAIVWIGGTRQVPTQAALDTIAHAILELRRGGAGVRVIGHSDLRSTSCPHPTILGLARHLDRRPIPTVSEEEIMATTDELRQIIREELGLRTRTVHGRERRQSDVVTDSLFRVGWGSTNVQTFEDRFTELWLGVRTLLARDGRISDDDRQALAQALVDELPDDLAAAVLDGLGHRILGHTPN